MRIFIIVVGFVLVLGAGLLIALSSSNNTTANNQINFATIEADISQGAQLLDVRTADEFAVGHISGAQLLSLQDIESGKYPTIAKDAPVYVYCRSGNRSAQAKNLLSKAGFTNVTDLGGITKVESIGGQITKND